MSDELSPTSLALRLLQGAATSEPKLLTTKQAAGYLGVAVPTLRSWRHRRRGPKCFRMEGRVMYRLAELNAYVDACEAATDHAEGAAR